MEKVRACSNGTCVGFKLKKMLDKRGIGFEVVEQFIEKNYPTSKAQESKPQEKEEISEAPKKKSRRKILSKKD